MWPGAIVLGRHPGHLHWGAAGPAVPLVLWGPSSACSGGRGRGKTALTLSSWPSPTHRIAAMGLGVSRVRQVRPSGPAPGRRPAARPSGGGGLGWGPLFEMHTDIIADPSEAPPPFRPPRTTHLSQGRRWVRLRVGAGCAPGHWPARGRVLSPAHPRPPRRDTTESCRTSAAISA